MPNELGPATQLRLRIIALTMNDALHDNDH